MHRLGQSVSQFKCIHGMGTHTWHYYAAEYNRISPARGVLRGFINDLSLWLFRAKNPSCKAALRSWCDSFEHVIG